MNNAKDVEYEIDPTEKCVVYKDHKQGLGIIMTFEYVLMIADEIRKKSNAT